MDGGLGGGRQGERPHLEITATLNELASGVGTAILNRTGLPDGLAATPMHAARRVGCDSDIRLVLVDGQYRDPQTGRVACDAAASRLTAGVGILDYGRTQAHHVLHWIDFGDTCLANTVLLCSRHHHYVHEGGWTITARTGMHYTQPGYWQFTPPQRSRP